MTDFRRTAIQLLLGDSLFRLIPVRRNRILFSSFYGQHYSDGPRAISEAMHEMRPEAEIYWAFSGDVPHELPSYVRPLSMDSVAYYRVKATAGAIVSNVFVQGAYLNADGKGGFLTRLHLRLENRRKQISVTTWHGIPYKKMGNDQVGAKMKTFVCNQPSYYLPANRFEEEIMLHLTGRQLTPLHFGSPRTANALRCSKEKISSLRMKLGLRPEERVILYAPTFRSSDAGPDPERSGLSQLTAFSPTAVDKALQEQLGWTEWKLFCRFHNLVEREVDWSSLDPVIRNGNEREDIADYYSVADLVITDYSSLMFDAMRVGIPVILLCPDFETYLNQERGLYLTPEELPFPTLKGWEELPNALSIVKKPSYRNSVSAFMERLGYYDDELALERIVDFLLDPGIASEEQYRK